jgi:hypothetical protein
MEQGEVSNLVPAFLVAIVGSCRFARNCQVCLLRVCNISISTQLLLLVSTSSFSVCQPAPPSSLVVKQISFTWRRLLFSFNTRTSYQLTQANLIVFFQLSSGRHSNSKDESRRPVDCCAEVKAAGYERGSRG